MSDVEVVTDPEEAAHAHEATPDLDDEEADGELAHIQAVIRGLRVGGNVQVWRVKPTWCAGFLTSIQLEQGEEIDLRQLKADWGGGELRLRPQVNTPNGVRYAKGGGTIKIAGPPRDQGREITPEGFIGPRALPSPVPTAPAVRQANVDPTMQVMLTLVQQMMGVMFQEQATRRRPEPQRDTFEEFRKFLALQGELKKVLVDEDQGDEEEPAPTSNTLDSLVGLLLKKYEEKEEKKKRPAAPSAPQWRLIKGAAGAAPQQAPNQAPNQAPASAAQVWEQFSRLSETEKMELLGNAASKMDTELIRRWMVSNGMGEAVGS